MAGHEMVVQGFCNMHPYRELSKDRLHNQHLATIDDYSALVLLALMWLAQLVIRAAMIFTYQHVTTNQLCIHHHATVVEISQHLQCSTAKTCVAL
jgi:hypothetical protein